MKGLAASIGTLFTDLPLPQRFDAAMGAGFDALELALPYSDSAESLCYAREATGLPVVLFTAPLGDFLEGGEGVACVPGRQDDFRDSVARALEYAEALEAEYVQFVAGRCLDAAQRNRYLNTYAENLAFALDTFSASGTQVLAEAINSVDFPHCLLACPDDIRALSVSVPLIFDPVHLVQMGIDPVLEWREHAADYQHVQLADVPGRCLPGGGTIDFAALVTSIFDSAYPGWISAEYRAGSMEQCSRQAFAVSLGLH